MYNISKSTRLQQKHSNRAEISINGCRQNRLSASRLYTICFEDKQRSGLKRSRTQKSCSSASFAVHFSARSVTARHLSQHSDLFS
ncbi:unnamed protein product [Protopolystoma xenopodis]|uniref:Uncharacterized protein n=1 Tax=Protopolystoma xenopodis TaxID=117903 RepID=A0A448WGA5_9PLAT|nr:unnamed protein product [Protopolystoma xenopodis]